MNYTLHLRNRPFQAIKNGTKRVEGRAPNDSHDKQFEEIKPGDYISFENEETNEIVMTEVVFVHHYSSVKEMLEKEGPENVLSSKGTIEQGIESYYSLGDYKERIHKFGIYAIGIKLLN